MSPGQWLNGLHPERLVELLREFPPEEPTRKRFIQEMINWSGRFGPLERGDPELHHAAGSVYAEGMWFMLFFSGCQAGHRLADKANS